LSVSLNFSIQENRKTKNQTEKNTLGFIFNWLHWNNSAIRRISFQSALKNDEIKGNFNPKAGEN
jgi:hypothetical protein